jgi:ADP-ribose pyrophosphatase YjhB (NUDIX family)
MRRRWRQITIDDVVSGERNVPEWVINYGDDYREFCWGLKRYYDRECKQVKCKPVDLEVLLETPSVDVKKRRAPIILFIADTINLISRGEGSVAAALDVMRELAPPGYTVLASNNFLHFYSEFYSGIDDALPAMIISTEELRAKNVWDDEGYYGRSNIRDICRRRDIPLVTFPGGHYECQKKRNLSKINKYLRHTLPPIFNSLPPVDTENHSKMFGVYYPIGEFVDRGRPVRMPYAVLEGERIPIIAATTMIVRNGELFLMMQEAKKGSGDKRIDVSKWSFPGGRLEEGEVPHEAVLRELSEETSYTGVVNGLLGLFARVNANGRLIMKAAYTGSVNGSHCHPLAEDSLGYGYFDKTAIDHLSRRGLIKTSDQRIILQAAMRAGVSRSVYNVVDVEHPGVLRMLKQEK